MFVDNRDYPYFPRYVEHIFPLFNLTMIIISLYSYMISKLLTNINNLNATLFFQINIYV